VEVVTFGSLQMDRPPNGSVSRHPEGCDLSVDMDRFGPDFRGHRAQDRNRVTMLHPQSTTVTGERPIECSETTYEEAPPSIRDRIEQGRVEDE
jgi:hypothetical protein